MIEIYECSGCRHWVQDDEVLNVGKCTNAKNTFCGRWVASDAACSNYEACDESIHDGH